MYLYCSLRTHQIQFGSEFSAKQRRPNHTGHHVLKLNSGNVAARKGHVQRDKITDIQSDASLVKNKKTLEESLWLRLSAHIAVISEEVEIQFSYMCMHHTAYLLLHNLLKCSHCISSGAPPQLLHVIRPLCSVRTEGCKSVWMLHFGDNTRINVDIWDKITGPDKLHKDELSWRRPLRLEPRCHGSRSRAIWCVEKRRGWGSIPGCYITTGRSGVCIQLRTKDTHCNCGAASLKKGRVVSHIKMHNLTLTFSSRNTNKKASELQLNQMF